MNKYIKQTILGLALALSLFTVAHAQAAAQFAVQSGSYPTDLPLVLVQRCVSGGACSSNPAAYSPSISGVQPGDLIWVMLYYRNVGDATGINTKFTLTPQTTGTVTQQTFSGTLHADNSSTVFGSASVSLAQGTTLAFQSARLYAHNAVQIPIPYGQSGSELFTGGLNIGNIATSASCTTDTFCNQGVVVATYTVTPIQQQQVCTITQFSANPSSINSGQSSTLSWATSGCNSAIVTGGGLSAFGLNGSQGTGALSTTTTYTLTAYNSLGQPITQTRTVNVTPVQQQSCVITQFNAFPTQVTSGQSSNISWATSGCTSAIVTGGNLSAFGLFGSQSTGILTNTTTYTITAYNSLGQPTSQNVTVTVTPVQQQSCVITQFSALPSAVNSGQSSNVSWSTSGCVSAHVSGGNISASGLFGSQTTGALNITTTYTLVAYNSLGVSTSQTVTVTVIPVQQPVCSITQFIAFPTQISSGQSATVSWTTSGCVSAILSGGNISGSGLTGTHSTGTLTNTTTYTITAYNSLGQSTSQNVTVTVIPVQQPVCQITQFVATPYQINSGQSSTISWATSGCASAHITGGNTSVSGLTGSQTTGTLTNTTTYTIVAYNSLGQSITQTATVVVNPVIINNPQCVINSFYSNPQSISYGATTTLSWVSTNCTTLSISGGSITNPNNLPTSGSVTTNALYGSTTFILNASGPYNTASAQSAVVSVAAQYVPPQQQPPIYYPPPPVYYPPPVYTQPPVYYPPQTTYYQACSISSFTASPTSVTSGGSSTLNWNTIGCTNVSLSGQNISNSNQSTSGSMSTGSLSNQATYTLSAYGTNGSDSRSVSVSITTPAVATSVVTGPPTNVGATSARLNGVVYQANTSNTNVSFQWGTSQILGNSTVAQNAGSVSSTPYFDSLFSLFPDTTYYYRAVATNTSGTYYGEIRSFSTGPRTVIVQTPPAIPTGIGSGSNLVSLSIVSTPQSICVDDTITYTITYKNISGKTLENAIVHVVLPTDVFFLSANPGIYNSADHTVTQVVGTLLAEQSGSFTITGKITKSAINENVITTSATIAFLYPANNSQESAVAYALNSTSECPNSNLAGLALFGSGFWPTTLIGWLIIILLILLLIYFARPIYQTTTRRFYPVAPVAKKNANGGLSYTPAPHDPAPAPHYEEMNIPTYEDEI